MSNTRLVYKTDNTCGSLRPSLEYITYSKDEGDWESRLHSHPFIEIIYAVGGAGTVTVGSDEFSIEEGDIVLIPSNTMHTEASAVGKFLEYYVMGVDDLDIGQFVIKDENDQVKDITELSPVIKRHNLEDRQEIESIFIEIYYEMKLRKVGYEVMVQSLLLKLSALILRAFNRKPKVNNTEEIQEGCAKIKDYIDTHYAAKIKIDTLSDMSGISKFHLIHVFGEYTGMPPIAYQLKRKIQEAKNLLATTDSTINSIATSLGFSSISHFSQRFKKEEGCSPLKYRQRQKLH